LERFNADEKAVSERSHLLALQWPDAGRQRVAELVSTRPELREETV
jgi:hypothetical protein